MAAMTHHQRIYMEGFMDGLLCLGTPASKEHYKAGSPAFKTWTRGYIAAKALGAGGAEKVLYDIYRKHPDPVEVAGRE